jgi:hypothetical protein
VRDRAEPVEVDLPEELESFAVWCMAGGEVDERGYHTGDRAVWRAARAHWLAAHGLPADVWPPDELVSYEVWAANRGLVAFGEFGSPAGDVAAQQYELFLAERREWGAAHGVDEQVMDLDGSAPVCWI